MKHKLLSLFVALIATTALGAQNNVITYIATEKLTGYKWDVGGTIFGPAITSHDFSNGLGTITCDGEITTIGEYAFADCEGLTSVTIPNSVKTIENRAFYKCSGLISVTIPSSVTTIGSYAFDYCLGLTKTNYTGTIADWCKIKFGNYSANPISYSHNFFINDIEVKDLVIPEGVESIGNNAFFDCDGLTSVVIGNSVTTIGNSAFWSCSGLTSVTIGNSVTTIGKDAFYWCIGLTSVVIGNSVTTIGEDAFYYCTALTSVTIPNSVTSIGQRAFNEVKYANIYVRMETPFTSATISSIITYAFDSFCHFYIIGSVAEIVTLKTPSLIELDVDISQINEFNYDSVIVVMGETKKPISLDNITHLTFTGLHPDTEYTFTYKGIPAGKTEWKQGISFSITTPALTLTTLTPKVVSAGTAVVAASTNISDYETNVGFEWRKFDAPSTMPSKSGAAVIYNGMMEGKLLNLGTDSYWNVRPYYEAADGTRYYGEWITFDPGDFSYFEPTVHTYALATSPTSNKTQVRGYVMTGTDDVTEQGFEYWFNGSKAPRRVASATPDSVYRVQASGQVMTAVLEDLAYSTTYTCRAYAVAGGKTYYGEEVQFLTPEDPRPIYTLSVIAGENGSVNTDVSGQYREGETVTLTATAEQGFRFVQWSDGNTDNPRQLTMTANTELVAFFELADGLEQLTIDNAQCTIRKMIIDNQLFIFRGGKIFNAAGGLIK